jgi:hypothetical protein
MAHLQRLTTQRFRDAEAQQVMLASPEMEEFPEAKPLPPDALPPRTARRLKRYAEEAFARSLAAEETKPAAAEPIERGEKRGRESDELQAPIAKRRRVARDDDDFILKGSSEEEAEGEMDESIQGEEESEERWPPARSTRPPRRRGLRKRSRRGEESSDFS